MNLELRDVHCRYGSREAIAGVTVSATGGSVVALIGNNGSGKTTLLRACAGLRSVEQGQVLLDGAGVAELGVWSRARRMVFVPQRPSLSADFSVRDVVALGRYPWGGELLPNGEIDTTLARVGAAEFADRRFDELSAGERQRVVLARAVTQLGPNGMAVLDEPFSAMDAPTMVRCGVVLRELAKGGALVLVALHDIPFAASIADEVWWLRDGHLAAAGRAESVLAPDALSEHFGSQFELLGGDLIVRYARA